MPFFPRYSFFVIWLAVVITVSAQTATKQPATSLSDTSQIIVSDSSSDSSDEDEDTYEGTPESRIPPYMIDTSAITLRATPDSALAIFRNDPIFDYRKEVQQGISWWQLFKRWFWELVNELFSQKGFQQAWSIAEKLLIAGAIIALLLFFSKTGVRSLFSRSIAVTPNFDAIIENIHELDFTALINDAVRAGDFRRAVRLHYLRVLKSLTDAGVITWSPEKTNRDYTRELRRNAGSLAEEFIRLTLIFEQVRYGKYVVRLPEYSRLAPEFDGFSAVLRTIKLEQSV